MSNAGFLVGTMGQSGPDVTNIVQGAPSVTTMPVDPASGAGPKFSALIGKGAAVTLATPAQLSDNVTYAGVALAPFVGGGTVPILTQGPLLGFSLGPGSVCAVGTDAAGALVRASAPACVSRLMYMGYCDAAGAVFVSPFTRTEFVITDYGADPTGVALCDAALSAVLHVATEGDSVLIPQGTFRYASTFGPLPIGVTIRGVGSEVVTPGVTYLGSVLQYEGVGDAIRVANDVNFNAAGNWLLENFLVRCTNANNQAPQRQSPSIVLPGAVVTMAAAPGGAIRVTMSVATGLVEGNLVCVDGATGTVEANGGWAAHVVSATSFDLIGSTFVHAYTGGARVRMRCGAGVANIGGGEATYRNVYATGFGVGFLLDGAETIAIESCQADGYEGNSGLGSNVTRFQCAVWITDGDSGCNGWTVPGSSNVITCERCYFDGARISFQIDGTAQCNIVQCENPNIAQAGLKNTAITAMADDGGGQILVTAAANGVLDGQFVGIAGATGTIAPNANGEWKVHRIDADHFVLLGSVFAGAYTGNGVVAANCPATFARINRAEQLKFDSCYTEGVGDAVFIFARQTGSESAQTSSGVKLENHFHAGVCSPIHVASSAVDGAHAAVSVTQLQLMGNGWYACTQSTGGGQVSGNYIQVGDTFSCLTPDFTFWDTNLAASSGIVSYFNSNGSHFVNAIGGLEGLAQLFLFVQDNATPIIRVADSNVADYLRLNVQTRSSTSFARYVNSPGFGDRAGRDDQERSALLAAGSPVATIATSDAIPPNSNSVLYFSIVAHSDDDVAANGAFWLMRLFVGQLLNGSLAILDGPHLIDSFVPAGPGWVAPTFAVSGGNAIAVRAPGIAAAASTWEVSFPAINSQRAR